jgi:hypothetical protein
VPHIRLLKNLEYYGIRGENWEWLKSFLGNRTQQVVVDGEKSSESAVTSGVPQGSVVGPILFLIFINDIASTLNCSTRLFADDCLIYKEITTPDDTKTLQADLDKLVEWSQQWQMYFNVDKCYIMRVTLARKNKILNKYTMSGKFLCEAKDQPYLGVHLNDKLSWDTHVANITGKAKRALGFLNRNLSGCHKNTNERAYISLVRPLVDYCCVVWDPHQEKLKKQVESVQRAGARFVMGTPHR